MKNLLRTLSAALALTLLGSPLSAQVAGNAAQVADGTVAVQMLHLRDGRTLWGSIEDHDVDGFVVQRLDNSGRVRLPWATLDPKMESALRTQFGYVDELTPPLNLGVGELLVDVSSPFGLLATGFLIGGNATINEPVPNDPTLVSFVLHTQGFFNNVGGSGLLTNGIELTFGTF